MHLYSGQRREGDLQDWVEKLSSHYGLSVVALSVDVVHDAGTADLTDENTVRRLREGLWSG
eukprot:4867239-Prorocentrum_lima.AAC.1